MKTPLLSLVFLSLALPLAAGWLVSPDAAGISYSAEQGKGHATFDEALKEMSESGRILKMKWIGVDLFGDEKFQKELFDCLERDAPRELREALESSGNMHNPKMHQLWKPFERAFSATPTIAKFNASLALYGLTISRPGVEKFELRSSPTDPKRRFYGLLSFSVIKSPGHSPSGDAGGVFDNPSLLFPNSYLPVLSRFEKAKIETTLRGFYLRADTFPGFKQEHDPSDAGLYLNVAVRDPEEIPKFTDSSKIDGEITERTVEFPKLKNGEVALRIVFTCGSHANPEALKAISSDIESVIKQVNEARAAENLVDDKLAAKAEVVLRVKRLTGGEGSKYWWYQVEVLQELKNLSGETFSNMISIAAYSGKDGVPEGESTIYLERYNPTAKELWKLVGGEASTGVSHVKKP